MGKSNDQVIGYKYFTNFLLFIGNPIEKLLGINFDKRGWLTGERASHGDGEMIYIEAPNLYGETEGGVSGVMNLKYGTNSQTTDETYKAYMESIGLQASAYPYQSYISFGGGGLDGIVPGSNAFYVGNSGYMKEMLLWPKRIHVRNDGRAQWYDEKAETPTYKADETLGLSTGKIEANDSTYTFPSVANTGTTISAPNFPFFGGMNWGGSGVAPGQYKAKVVLPGMVRYLIKISADNECYFSFNAKNTIIHSINKYGGGSQEYIDLDVSVFFGGDILTIIAENTYWYSNPNGYSPCSISFRADVIDTYSETGASGGDINPVHKIREILTDDTAMNKPETFVNNANFIKAADRIWDEALGISWSITEKSCMDAINELCYHIEAGIRVNRQTGLYEMVLFRDDWFSEEEIHTIAESKIKKGSMQYEISNADEVINQVNVNYYDRANIKNSSFSISESGLIQTLGRVNAETVDFPYFMNMRNAEIMGNSKLKVLSTGVFKGSFSTGWRGARKWNRYDLIKLPWSRRWVEPILVRIMNIKLGGPTSNEVSIEWVEVVPSTGMMNTTIVADDPVNTQPETPKPCNAKIFELPYFEAVQAFGEREVNTELADNQEAGYLCAIAEKPQNNSLNAALYADGGNGFERVATINYCETAYLDQAIDRMSSTFIVKNVGNIASVRVGSQIFINDETMVYQSYDAETKVLTAKRGAFGVPQNHAVNSILYFADDFVAVDQTLYVDSEIVDAKVLTTTPSGVLALSDAATYEVEFNARAIRPYPPANVKINGNYWPVDIETDLILTWVDRNRLQQTGGETLGWYEDGVTIESGTSTILTIKELDVDELVVATHNIDATGTNTYTLTISAMQADTRFVKVTLKTVRDGYESLQKFEHIFSTEALDAPYNLKLKYMPDVTAPYDLKLEYL